VSALSLSESTRRLSQGWPRHSALRHLRLGLRACWPAGQACLPAAGCFTRGYVSAPHCLALRLPPAYSSTSGVGPFSAAKQRMTRVRRR
jgi:hypothetical protein